MKEKVKETVLRRYEGKFEFAESSNSQSPPNANIDMKRGRLADEPTNRWHV